jgi:hypothetical protein
MSDLGLLQRVAAEAADYQRTLREIAASESEVATLAAEALGRWERQLAWTDHLRDAPAA